MTALAIPAMLVATHAFAAVNSGSTGADNALTPTGDITVILPPDGILNYTKVDIPAGVTVTFKKNKLNTPVYMLVQQDVNVQGFIDVRGANGKDVGIYGDGVQADDGEPGQGGPGGFDGGRGGREDALMRPEMVDGGPGQGPGGGPGGIFTPNSGAVCTPLTSAYSSTPYYGGGAGHSAAAYRQGTLGCGPVSNVGLPFYGKAYGSSFLQPLVGGSGGGGGRGGSSVSGSGGGGGGGAILIAANGTINIAAGGRINATGGDSGGVKAQSYWAGLWGGGGSGGAIRLVASKITGTGGLYAAGGCSNYGGSVRYSCGGPASWDGSSGGYLMPTNVGGAHGRTRLEADFIDWNGPQVPSVIKDVPGPIFLSSMPSLRITSVAGLDVPAEPADGADVSLREAPSDPVMVTFKTVNVPPGNTVSLRVTPEYGDAIEMVSPAIAGSLLEGTASLSVKLPAGMSALMASTKYTVSTPVAAAPALYRYANNEKVEQIELTVATEGEPKAQLITASGKRIDISYAQLLAAGFKG